MAASTPTLASNAGGSGLRALAARLGLAGITVVALVVFAVYAAVLASRADELAVGDPVPVSVPGGVAPGGPLGAGLTAPEFALRSVDGETVRLSDYAGRPVWLNVWASWCAPCRAEMPDIEQVYREAGGGEGDGPALLLISLGEDPADVRRYLDATRYRLPVLLDPEFTITRDYRVSGLPTHYFVDREGRLRDLAIGGLKPNGMRARLARITGQ